MSCNLYLIGCKIGRIGRIGLLCNRSLSGMGCYIKYVLYVYFYKAVPYHSSIELYFIYCEIGRCVQQVAVKNRSLYKIDRNMKFVL